MRDEDALLLLLGLVVVAGGKRESYPWGDGWVWPVPPLMLGGVRYDPVISDGFNAARPGAKPDGLHRGVDILYERRSVLDVPQFKPRTHDGTKWYFAPRLTPILAARAGRVWSVDSGVAGRSVVIDHGKPWATWYQHLETAAVLKGQTVSAGQPIGFMGYSNADGEQLRHLHFATWFNGNGPKDAVDPQRAMSSWAYATPWRM